MKPMDMQSNIQKTDLLSLLPENIILQITEMGYPEYRGEQLVNWLARGVRDFSEMQNLPKKMREDLSEHFTLFRPQVMRKQESKIDGTVKFLWQLADGNAIETVVMSYPYGNTVCISSQVGCRQGCAFCASTIGGLVRNLTAGEMLDEVLFSEIESAKKINHIVLMGIGEPLDNFDSVVQFLKLVNHKKGMNIGYRHISLSTCGITERFHDLALLDIPITLSVSLHAPDDETRDRIMPANHGRGINELMKACNEYFKMTGRRISFEYAMIRGVNDSEKHAELLAQRAKEVGAHVNLIPLNHVDERNLTATSDRVIHAFKDKLEEEHVNVTIRRKLGSDIEASCGQLRRNTIRETHSQS